MAPSNRASDEHWMRRCIELALQAKAAGNSPVGSLIVLEGRVVAEAAEEAPAGPDAFAHSEILAIGRAQRKMAKRHLPEAVLYSTAEPCFLCSYAVRESRIGKLVIALPTPEIGGFTSDYRLLADESIGRWGASPLIEMGLLEQECRRRLFGE